MTGAITAQDPDSTERRLSPLDWDQRLSMMMGSLVGSLLLAAAVRGEGREGRKGGAPFGVQGGCVYAARGAGVVFYMEY